MSVFLDVVTLYAHGAPVMVLGHHDHTEISGSMLCINWPFDCRPVAPAVATRASTSNRATARPDLGHRVNSDCATVPVRTHTWGALKLIYH